MIFSRLIKRLQSSYTAKVICMFTAALFLLGGILNFTFLRLQEKSYREYMQTNGMATARLLAKTLELDVFSENIDGVNKTLDAFENYENIIKVEVSSDTGIILVSRCFHKGKDHLSPSTEALRNHIRKNTSFFKEWPDSFSFWSPVTAIPAYTSVEELYFDQEIQPNEDIEPPRILGYVTLLISKEHYEDQVKQIFFRTGLTIFLIVILLTSGVFFIFRRMTKPLRNLIIKIKQERNIGESHDEIGLLDTTLTTLVEDLDHSFHTINELTNSLENKVVKRTRQLALANEELTSRQHFLEEANKKLEDAMRELQDTEGQLVQSEKMAAIGQVVAGVAHEINNNINFISGALPSLDRTTTDLKRLTDKYSAACCEPTEGKLNEARALQEELGKDEIFESLGLLMKNIYEGVNRTTKIIADLKTFSRADEQGYKAIDLHESIDSSITFLKKEHMEHVTIIKNYGEIPRVTCRPDRINQVFLNIMNNALYAMVPQGGTLSITTFRINSHVHVCFSDTGVGISKEVLPKIFDPFFTSKNIGEGSGIGLAISYKIIEQHGGCIEVASGEGKGSNFEVILPIENKKLHRHGENHEVKGPDEP